MKSKIDSIYIQYDGERICQGDILRDFKYIEWVGIKNEKIVTMEWEIPYLVVLTQDCDLELDYRNHTTLKENQDKFLHSVLVCPAYHAEKLRQGIHLQLLGLKMEKVDSKRWKLIETNQNMRYHFLQRNIELHIPDLTIDFKHYYTVQRDFLYKKIKEHYIVSINELFREALSQRFSYYLSRIGLPLIKSER